MASAMYELGVNKIMTATVDLDDNTTTTIKAALMDLNHTISQADEFFSSITANKVGTPGEITTKTVGSVAAKVFNGDDVVFSAVSGNRIDYIVIYKDTGVEATSPLLAVIDLTATPTTPNGDDITVVWNASGIFKL